MLSTDAVRRDAGGQTYVLVARDGHAQRTDVTLGLQGVGTTQILSGVAAGEQIILPTTAATQGDRVRAKGVAKAGGNAPMVPGLNQ